jgi:hypothetical protein
MNMLFIYKIVVYLSSLVLDLAILLAKGVYALVLWPLILPLLLLAELGEERGNDAIALVVLTCGMVLLACWLLLLWVIATTLL